jgi:hypothetical protein
MVAIKDVEMPKNCAECMVRQNCKVSDEWDEFDWYYDGRLEGCPLVEIEENKVGKWIDCGHVDRGFRKYKCSICSDFVYEKEYLIKHHKYCLHCGADMVGAENEN